jgi:hypothetical protein
MNNALMNKLLKRHRCDETTGANDRFTIDPINLTHTTPEEFLDEKDPCGTISKHRIQGVDWRGVK